MQIFESHYQIFLLSRHPECQPLYQLLTFFKSLFSSFAQVFISYTTLTRDSLSANNFVLEDKSPDKSII